MAGLTKHRRAAWLLPLGLAWGVALTVASDGRAAPPSAPEFAEPGDPQAAPSPNDEALLEFHFNPADNLQIAIWLEGADGTFLEDVFVTQATAKLGIGNRSGMFLFLSSWRAPYGPRESVLPIWAHRRGKTYPKIIFHDASVSNHTSLGFHESSSSPETYFCRPLLPSEDEALQLVDVMSCPSPAVFQSDKGEFKPGETSIYPPRNDLTNFDDPGDGPDPIMYDDLNELDALSRATPVAGKYLFAHRIRRGDVPEGPLVAWIEVSLEWDENPDWDFDRAADHWIDPKLASYGREWLGQPAVVYRVEFDPAVPGYTSVTEYGGYADWDGATGTLHPPDSTISTSGSSGADRLRIHDQFGESARFGIYTHGWDSMMPGDGDGDGDPGDGDGDPGDGDGDTGGGGSCTTVDLPPVEDLTFAATEFNEVVATFTLPEVPEGIQLATLYAAWITPETDDFQLGSAKEVSGIPRLCRDPGEVGCIDAGPGDEVSITIGQLFGNYTYTMGVFVEDACTNRSEIAVGEVTTPVQPFQTIEGACFVATAAWGAGWTEELRALRAFRDGFMIDIPIAKDLVRTYYAYGPVLANMIRDIPPARAAARLLLRPVVGIAKRAVAARW